MIKDGSSISNGTVLPHTQVCIIGSGPAGITAAWELQNAGIKVILLEGSRDYRGLSYQASWPDKTLLYAGETSGLFAANEPEFLILPYESHQPAWERERIYGGTSAHWGGETRPEDPIDFENRPGYTGWPINRANLDPYYDRASALCKLHGEYDSGANFSAESWARILSADVPKIKYFDAEMYQSMGASYLNFSSRTFDGKTPTTIGNTSVQVILNASLLEIEHQQGNVKRLRVASTNPIGPLQQATEFFITADLYVLACGAVANAHQLLLSNVGNEHDQVGRYFMCHPLSGMAINMPSFLPPAQARLLGGKAASGGQWTDTNGVTVTGRFIPSADETRKRGIGRCWFWYQWGQYYFEMAPNKDSRITLSNRYDNVFHRHQASIHWELSPLDQKTYEQTTSMFNDAVGGVTFPAWDLIKRQFVVNGHHIGTTRMSDAPAAGVVDKNLKVHSVNNLYVAGSSVFPSAGISNPTFTIIALSIRLADHLKSLVKNSPAKSTGKPPKKSLKASRM